MIDPAEPPPPLIPNPFERMRARWILLGWLAALALLVLVLELIPRTRGTVGTVVAVGAAVQYAALGLVLALAARRSGLRWEWLFGPPLEPDQLKLLAIVLPVAAVSLGSFTLFWGPLSYLIPDVVQDWAVEGMPELLTPGNPLRMAAEALIIVIVAPIMEEILFRGLLLHRWSHRWGLRAGILLTSFAFGIVHVEPVGHVLFGVVMCTLYLATGSLWAPIAAHILNNALVMIVMLPDALRGERPETITLEMLRADWGESILLVLAGMVVLIWFLRRYLRIDGVLPPYVARLEAAEASFRDG